jgi:hypothetical protein
MLIPVGTTVKSNGAMHLSRRRDGAAIACLRAAGITLAFPAPARAPTLVRGRLCRNALRRRPCRFIPRPHGCMSDQTYDDGRKRNLEGLLRALAERIRELDAAGRLLANPAELTRLIGDVKSELFHYEVRATYDTPEVADSRRIIDEAIKQAEQGRPWQSTSGKEDGDDAPEW